MSYLIKRAIVIGLAVFTLLVFTLWFFSPLLSNIEPIGEDCCQPVQAKPPRVADE